MYIHRQSGKVVQVNSPKADKHGFVWVEIDGKTQKVSWQDFVRNYTLGVQK